MAFPGTYNFSYYRGDTYQFKIRPKNSDGSVFDLEDYENNALFTVATSRGDGATQVDCDAVVNIGENVVTCTIQPSEGLLLNAGTSYVYDIQIDNGAGVVYTLLTGTISVTDHVSGATPA
jgi:hypothetical protein